MDDLTGKTLLGNFELKEKRGSGQIADVYRAFDGQKFTQVALKVLHEHLAANCVFLRRFQSEIQTNENNSGAFEFDNLV